MFGAALDRKLDDPHHALRELDACESDTDIIFDAFRSGESCCPPQRTIFAYCALRDTVL